MSTEMKWIDAIAQVLREESEPLPYDEIAKRIAERGYRINLGATPANTVNANINNDLRANGEKSVFQKTDRGIYTLRGKQANKVEVGEPEVEKPRLIHSFGIYWSREAVIWKHQPDLYGIQQLGATPVNFRDQVGIYLLHDSRETIYIGQAVKQTLAERLFQHTKDRVGGRWDRFSWFGFYGVDADSAKLNPITDLAVPLTQASLADTLEAILIESVEPRQNRKRGNTFDGIEFLQGTDPEIERKKKQQLLAELIEQKL